MRFMLFAILLAFATITPAAPNQYASVPGGVCKPAGQAATNPGTNFAAKAIGGRNEGTSNVFVICPFVLTPTPVEGGVVTELNLSAYTLDGVTRPMTCTAVIGSLVRPTEPTYSSKTVSVSDASVFTWTPADFNGASSSGGIVGSAWATVTCLVPAQTAVGLMYAKLNPTIP